MILCSDACNLLYFNNWAGWSTASTINFTTGKIIIQSFYFIFFLSFSHRESCTPGRYAWLTKKLILWILYHCFSENLHLVTSSPSSNAMPTPWCQDRKDFASQCLHWSNPLFPFSLAACLLPSSSFLFSLTPLRPFLPFPYGKINVPSPIPFKLMGGIASPSTI